MYKAIIFDVDGTLSETEDIHRKAFNCAFETKNLTWNWDQSTYRNLLQVTGGKERIRHFIQEQDPQFMDTVDVDCWIRDLHATKTGFYTQMIESGVAKLRPGVRELIHEAMANGIRLAIATTTSVPNVGALLQSAFKSEGMFDVICAGDSVPMKKPAPDIYLMALELLELDAEDCIAIEDSRNGLLSAFRAGIDTIVTPGIYTDDQCFGEAVLVTDNLSDKTLQSVFDISNGMNRALGQRMTLTCGA